MVRCALPVVVLLEVELASTTFRFRFQVQRPGRRPPRRRAEPEQFRKFRHLLVLHHALLCPYRCRPCHALRLRRIQILSVFPLRSCGGGHRLKARRFACVCAARLRHRFLQSLLLRRLRA